MVKRLLKKYRYPPEDYEYAIDTVISQCELWTDNTEVGIPFESNKNVAYSTQAEQDLGMVAEYKPFHNDN